MIDGGSLIIPESGGTVFNMPSAEMFWRVQACHWRLLG